MGCRCRREARETSIQRLRRPLTGTEHWRVTEAKRSKAEDRTGRWRFSCQNSRNGCLLAFQPVPSLGLAPRRCGGPPWSFSRPDDRHRSSRHRRPYAPPKSQLAKKNVSRTDRIVRRALGGVLTIVGPLGYGGYANFAPLGSGQAIAIVAVLMVAVVLLVAGAASTCPIYRILGIDTPAAWSLRKARRPSRSPHKGPGGDSEGQTAEQYRVSGTTRRLPGGRETSAFTLAPQ